MSPAERTFEPSVLAIKQCILRTCKDPMVVAEVEHLDNYLRTEAFVVGGMRHPKVPPMNADLFVTNLHRLVSHGLRLSVPSRDLARVLSEGIHALNVPSEIHQAVFRVLTDKDLSLGERERALLLVTLFFAIPTAPLIRRDDEGYRLDLGIAFTDKREIIICGKRFGPWLKSWALSEKDQWIPTPRVRLAGWQEHGDSPADPYAGNRPDWYGDVPCFNADFPRMLGRFYDMLEKEEASKAFPAVSIFVYGALVDHEQAMLLADHALPQKLVPLTHSLLALLRCETIPAFAGAFQRLVEVLASFTEREPRRLLLAAAQYMPMILPALLDPDGPIPGLSPEAGRAVGNAVKLMQAWISSERLPDYQDCEVAIGDLCKQFPQATVLEPGLPILRTWLADGRAPSEHEINRYAAYLSESAKKGNVLPAATAYMGVRFLQAWLASGEKQGRWARFVEAFNRYERDAVARGETAGNSSPGYRLDEHHYSDLGVDIHNQRTAMALEQQGDVEQALSSLLDSAANIEKREAKWTRGVESVYRNIARLAFNAGRYDLAEKYCHKVLSREHASELFEAAAARYILAQVHLARGRTDKALSLLRTCVTDGLADVPLLLKMAGGFEATGHHAAAFYCWTEAANFGSSDACAIKAQKMMMLGALEEAVALLEEFVTTREAVAKTGRFGALLAEGYLRLGQPQRSLDALSRISLDEEMPREIHDIIVDIQGTALLGLDQPKLAEECFGKLLADGSTRKASALAGLGKVKMLNGAGEEALKLWKEARKADPSLGTAYLQPALWGEGHRRSNVILDVMEEALQAKALPMHVISIWKVKGHIIGRKEDAASTEMDVLVRWMVQLAHKLNKLPTGEPPLSGELEAVLTTWETMTESDPILRLFMKRLYAELLKGSPTEVGPLYDQALCVVPKAIRSSARPPVWQGRALLLCLQMRVRTWFVLRKEFPAAERLVSMQEESHGLLEAIRALSRVAPGECGWMAEEADDLMTMASCASPAEFAARLCAQQAEWLKSKVGLRIDAPETARRLARYVAIHVLRLTLEEPEGREVHHQQILFYSGALRLQRLLNVFSSEPSVLGKHDPDSSRATDRLPMRFTELHGALSKTLAGLGRDTVLLNIHHHHGDGLLFNEEKLVIQAFGGGSQPVGGICEGGIAKDLGTLRDRLRELHELALPSESHDPESLAGKLDFTARQYNLARTSLTPDNYLKFVSMKEREILHQCYRHLGLDKILGRLGSALLRKTTLWVLPPECLASIPIGLLFDGEEFLFEKVRRIVISPVVGAPAALLSREKSDAFLLDSGEWTEVVDRRSDMRNAGLDVRQMSPGHEAVGQDDIWRCCCQAGVVHMLMHFEPRRSVADSALIYASGGKSSASMSVRDIQLRHDLQFHNSLMCLETCNAGDPQVLDAGSRVALVSLLQARGVRNVVASPLVIRPGENGNAFFKGFYSDLWRLDDGELTPARIGDAVRTATKRLKDEFQANDRNVLCVPTVFGAFQLYGTLI